MARAPESIRRQRQHAKRPAEQVVGAARLEERAVTAVVLEHEQPNEQDSRRHGEGDRRPAIAPDAIEEGRHKSQKRQSRVEELGDGALGVGSGIGRNDVPQRALGAAMQRRSLVSARMASHEDSNSWAARLYRRAAALAATASRPT